jgi:hypothetical protein
MGLDGEIHARAQHEELERTEDYRDPKIHHFLKTLIPHIDGQSLPPSVIRIVELVDLYVFSDQRSLGKKPRISSGMSLPRRIARRQVETLVQPTGDPAYHHLHRPPQLGKSQCAARGAVAVRAGAVRDKERVHGIVHEFRFDDLAVRQIQRAGHVALREQGRAADIKQNEAGRAAGKRAGDVGTIGLELHRRAEVGKRGFAVGGGDRGDGVGGRHGWTLQKWFGNKVPGKQIQEPHSGAWLRSTVVA